MGKPRIRVVAALLAVLAIVLLLRLVLLTHGTSADGDLALAQSAESTPAPQPSSSSSDSLGVPSAGATGGNTSAPQTGAGPIADRGQRLLAGYTVALDPGHNGANGRHGDEIRRQVDAGGFLKDCNTTGAATDGGYAESAFAWATVVELRRRLEEMGARVVLTRPDDESWGPCVDERAAIANRSGADLLLSVHADGAPAQEHGFHVITPGLRQGFTDDIVEPSAELASVVRDALAQVPGLVASTYLGEDGIDRRDDLGTLNQADVPAVIVESGNFRNPDNAALLTSGDGQQLIADALAAAVVRFLAGRSADPTSQPVRGR